MSQSDALVYGTGIFLMTIVSGMSCSHLLFKGICTGTKVRVAVTNLIYRKVCVCVCALCIILFTGSILKFLSNVCDKEILLLF